MVNCEKLASNSKHSKSTNPSWFNSCRFCIGSFFQTEESRGSWKITDNSWGIIVHLECFFNCSDLCNPVRTARLRLAFAFVLACRGVNGLLFRFQRELSCLNDCFFSMGSHAIPRFS